MTDRARPDGDGKCIDRLGSIETSVTKKVTTDRFRGERFDHTPPGRRDPPEQRLFDTTPAGLVHVFQHR